MAHTVIFKSIREVDLSRFQFPQVAVFDKPEDYPDKAVARIFDNGKPTNIVIIADDTKKLRDDIRKYTNLVCFGRGAEDVLALECVYL